LHAPLRPAIRPADAPADEPIAEPSEPTAGLSPGATGILPVPESDADALAAEPIAAPVAAAAARVRETSTAAVERLFAEESADSALLSRESTWLSALGTAAQSRPLEDEPDDDRDLCEAVDAVLLSLWP
jgi:hypothetical protein